MWCELFYQGTKIIQLSAMVGAKGRIYAFESRPGRLGTLRKQLSNSGCDSKQEFE
jgi:16S rRNA C967 or C1407 C5-methylase (RsmB/RsmF family)